jgi:hypothetical protein
MFDQFKQSIQQAGDLIKEQAASIGDAAKAKGYQIIDKWVSILPQLEAYGFSPGYFSVAVSINPTLEVEMRADPKNFPLDRIQAILDENKGSTPIHLVFSTIKTTYLLHKKSKLAFGNPLSVRITVKLSPEIKVAYGKPLWD